jgi:hypothetical protein
MPGAFYFPQDIYSHGDWLTLLTSYHTEYRDRDRIGHWHWQRLCRGSANLMAFSRCLLNVVVFDIEYL